MLRPQVLFMCSGTGWVQYLSNESSCSKTPKRPRTPPLNRTSVTISIGTSTVLYFLLGWDTPGCWEFLTSYLSVFCCRFHMRLTKRASSYELKWSDIIAFPWPIKLVPKEWVLRISIPVGSRLVLDEHKMTWLLIDFSSLRRVAASKHVFSNRITEDHAFLLWSFSPSCRYFLEISFAVRSLPALVSVPVHILRQSRHTLV